MFWSFSVLCHTQSPVVFPPPTVVATLHCCVVVVKQIIASEKLFSVLPVAVDVCTIFISLFQTPSPVSCLTHLRARLVDWGQMMQGRLTTTISLRTSNR